MPALSARVIAWARARRDGLPQPANDGRIVARATPTWVYYQSDHSKIQYSDKTDNAECQGHGVQIPDCVGKWCVPSCASYSDHVSLILWFRMTYMQVV